MALRITYFGNKSAATGDLDEILGVVRTCTFKCMNTNQEHKMFLRNVNLSPYGRDGRGIKVTDCAGLLCGRVDWLDLQKKFKAKEVRFEGVDYAPIHNDCRFEANACYTITTVPRFQYSHYVMILVAVLFLISLVMAIKQDLVFPECDVDAAWRAIVSGIMG